MIRLITQRNVDRINLPYSKTTHVKLLLSPLPRSFAALRLVLQSCPMQLHALRTRSDWKRWE